MSARSATQIALLTAATAVTGLVGYAVYFDYMRRNNPEFRKNIRKQHKKLAAEAETRAKEERERNTKALRAALVEIQMEDQPVSPEQQEAYFQEQVAEGEKLASQGPDLYVEAATHFYRALRVYPQPVELLMIYQKVVPPPVFALLLELTALTGGAAGGPGVSAASTAPPPPPQASVADIDESSPATSTESAEAGSPNGASATSATSEWERVSDEGRRA
ncbi:hypothetical protein JCM24511_09877 [Saitozyma sp. JCM 24511]|nr:hypothetical protein JCM24511_09877 [Saitozyma sp. JCM 24511]